MNFRDSFVRGLAGAILAGASACASDTTVPTDSRLDGPWSSHDFRIGVVLDLTWTADSVKGSGTYTVLQGSLGCGGATLHGSGSVTLAASARTGAIAGHMTFDNGWSPPYTGTLTDSSSIDGAFQSIDAGPCPFVLFKGLVP